MRLPRDVSGQELAQRLAVFGYEETRQTGSHLRLTTQLKGEHRVPSPGHDPLRVGTLSYILVEVAFHQGLSKRQVTERLFG